MLATCYVVLQRVLQLIGLLCQSSEFQELEIVVLRHELTVLRRQIRRPALRQADRFFFAAASRLLPRVSWSSFLVAPTTLLDWHRRWWRTGGRTRDAWGDRRLAVRFAP